MLQTIYSRVLVSQTALGKKKITFIQSRGQIYFQTRVIKIMSLYRAKVGQVYQQPVKNRGLPKLRAPWLYHKPAVHAASTETFCLAPMRLEVKRNWHKQGAHDTFCAMLNNPVSDSHIFGDIYGTVIGLLVSLHTG